MPDENALPHRPWQILLYGRGTAEQRAWVFALLCRQQGLDVVMLELAGAERPVGSKQPAARQPRDDFWLPAAGVDGQLYLFDTRLGLPIPGPGGEGVATLDQVQQDDDALAAARS